MPGTFCSAAAYQWWATGMGWFCLHCKAMFWGRPTARGQTQLFISDGQEPALQYQPCLCYSELNSHHSQVLAGYSQIKPILGKALSQVTGSQAQFTRVKKIALFIYF